MKKLSAAAALVVLSAALPAFADYHGTATGDVTKIRETYQRSQASHTEGKVSRDGQSNKSSASAKTAGTHESVHR
jgi:hypothetical protein